MGNTLVANEKREEVLSNAIRKIYTGLSGTSTETDLESIQSQKEKLDRRKDMLLDYLLDGTITKAEYASKTEDIINQIHRLSEKEIAREECESANEELFKRLNKVRELFENEEENGISVPLMCSHIEQMKVYGNSLDVYLDFLKSMKFISAEYDKNRKKFCYDMPICRGRKLPGRCEGNL